MHLLELHSVTCLHLQRGLGLRSSAVKQLIHSAHCSKQDYFGLQHSQGCAHQEKQQTDTIFCLSLYQFVIFSSASLFLIVCKSKDNSQFSLKAVSFFYRSDTCLLSYFPDNAFLLTACKRIKNQDSSDKKTGKIQCMPVCRVIDKVDALGNKWLFGSKEKELHHNRVTFQFLPCLGASWQSSDLKRLSGLQSCSTDMDLCTTPTLFPVLFSFLVPRFQLLRLRHKNMFIKHSWNATSEAQTQLFTDLIAQCFQKRGKQGEMPAALHFSSSIALMIRCPLVGEGSFAQEVHLFLIILMLQQLLCVQSADVLKCFDATKILY